MPKYLYLMRHGETLFNQLKLVQGACDSPLTDKGVKQAQAAKKYFEKQNITFDQAYASTQERACDTLEIVTSSPYTRLKGLKEMNFGKYEAQATYLQPKGPHTFETFYADYGGERAETVRRRMYDTLFDIMNENKNAQHTLAVSHNGACFYFLAQIWKKEYGTQPIQLPNCCIIKLCFTNNEFHLIDIIDPAKTA
ncbi:histidine phosphatase family protein [Enterococcus saccharolyticus]|uniref:Phosphoglycerate mutase n=1 Tax=Candidatus Enterococcus willemsii TaxID=1857215 RepID=A0ABQ6YYS1_9ENTE|nr:histidine phosphatase family protein [Enterococcus sp. CU12B]KAF1302785.1 phosphoglycerate mutase [Enterococcus sp. CU12B]MCD5002350.1 histidine phosphatase family protein [Enterococcus saccharolyticus]